MRKLCAPINACFIYAVGCALESSVPLPCRGALCMDGGQQHLLCCRYWVLEDGSLHIPWAQVADTGRYVCMASNAAGSERQRIDLHVLGKARA